MQISEQQTIPHHLERGSCCSFLQQKENPKQRAHKIDIAAQKTYFCTIKRKSKAGF
jgi:hypothetical protein